MIHKNLRKTFLKNLLFPILTNSSPVLPRGKTIQNLKKKIKKNEIFTKPIPTFKNVIPLLLLALLLLLLVL